MENQKLDVQLQSALGATAEELSRSPELATGYHPTEKTWEIIIRYIGVFDDLLEQIKKLGEQLSIPTEELLTPPNALSLLNNYGILTLPQELVSPVATLPQITYMEKPKQLFFEDYKGRQASCLSTLQARYPNQFTGKNVFVGIIDSGIDYMHPDFQNEDGTTRIYKLWDQTFDAVYTADEINQAIKAASEKERTSLCPSQDISGHGTHVAGIAAGNGRASAGIFRGIAYESTLLIVKLAPAIPEGFPSTVQLMEAIDFCIRNSTELAVPLSLNISFGNCYGSHSGTSLLETYLDSVALEGKVSISIGTGNEGTSAGHIGGRLTDSETQLYEFSVADYTSSLNLQIWKSFEDDLRFYISSPAGGTSVTIDPIPGLRRQRIGNSILYINYGLPSPYSIYQEIYIEFSASSQDPANAYLDAGIWGLSVQAIHVTDGIWDVWLPSAFARSEKTRFLSPTPQITLTIPSTASRAISVGAYDSTTDTYAAFSGRGYTWQTKQVKPDIVAPGVGITSCAPGGGYSERTGTSMSTPFVTGTAACLMQWGIIEGNDPYLYGEKLKAYLRKNARTLPAFNNYPNPQLGWGALCVKDVLPQR